MQIDNILTGIKPTFLIFCQQKLCDKYTFYSPGILCLTLYSIRLILSDFQILFHYLSLKRKTRIIRSQAV